MNKFIIFKGVFLFLSLLSSCSKKLRNFEKFQLLSISYYSKQITPNSELFISALVNSKKIKPMVKTKYKLSAILLNIETKDTFKLIIYGKNFFYFFSEMYESRKPLLTDYDFEYLTGFHSTGASLP